MAGAGEGATSTAGVASRSGATEAWRDGGAGVAAFEAGAGVGAGAASGAGVALGENAADAAGVGERALGGGATSAGAMSMVVVVKDEGRKERAGDDYRAELGPWQREFEDCRRIRLLVKIGQSAFVRLTFCDGISHASVHRRCHFCSHSLKVLGYVICDISALFPFWARFSRDQSCDRAPRLPRVGIGPSCDWPRTPRLDRPPCPPPSI